ncbi:hypothetical protein OPV22_004722 [Ensete ventricosum]|uniref:Epidermal patterning factor-like protein n=1 Tax=Ensete ventricosum TaxID=4639 RepID=A0AAV8RMZ9_ENSVE|nr:hypothetical protein OPV22_004722 [Ensete ventricosum]
MRGGWASRMALLCCVSFSFLSAFALLKETGIGSPRTKYFVQGPWPAAREVGTAAAEEEGERRGLMGPGSYPPRCASKCGKCTPCRPVHVPVPPGTPVTSEYYPEAWRCKCGNRLYVP